MDIFFQDPNEVPLPPNEVRIRILQAEPWPDKRRVRLVLEVDPFQKRPCVDVNVFDHLANLVAQTSIIQFMSRKMEFNLHLRQPVLEGRYFVQATLYYQKEIAEPPPGEPVTLPEPVQVDQKEAFFEISN